MKTGYANEAELPFLQLWADCEPEVDWHTMRVLVELEEGSVIQPSDLAHLVREYGADKLDIEAFEYPGCGPRLRIVAYLEWDE